MAQNSNKFCNCKHFTGYEMMIIFKGQFIKRMKFACSKQIGKEFIFRKIIYLHNVKSYINK